MPFNKRTNADDASVVELLPGEAITLLRETYSVFATRNIITALRAAPGCWTVAGPGVLIQWVPGDDDDC